MCLYSSPVQWLLPSCRLWRFVWKTLCGRWIFTHTHTHCDIYGHIFFFVSGSEFVTTSLIIASVLPLLLGICSFSCLRREPDYWCPQNQDSYYGRRFNCWVCTLGWGCVCGGAECLPTSWLCTFSFPVTDFWTPASVWKTPNPHHLQCRCFGDCNPPLLLFSFYPSSSSSSTCTLYGAADTHQPVNSS